jgi:hypothetical protein
MKCEVGRVFTLSLPSSRKGYLAGWAEGELRESKGEKA